MMKTASIRINQAFNDGRNAFAEGKALDSNPRKAIGQKAAWVRGYEFERRLQNGAKMTPEQVEEGKRVAAKFKEFVNKLTFQN